MYLPRSSKLQWFSTEKLIDSYRILDGGMFLIYTTPPLCKREQCKWNSFHHLMQETIMEATAWLTEKASLTGIWVAAIINRLSRIVHYLLKKSSRKNVTPSISDWRKYQGSLFSSFEVWRLLYTFFKPDQNSACCLLLNYVSLKHKCVSFRKLQISAFPYSLGKDNFNRFVLGRKNIACIINTGELSVNMAR